MNLFNCIFYFKRIKKNKKNRFILPRADVAERSHVATREHVSVWHVDTRVCECA